MSISLDKGVHLVHVQQQYILTRPGLDLARLDDLTIRPQRMSRQKMHSNHDEEIRRQHYSQATQGPGPAAHTQSKTFVLDMYLALYAIME